MQDSHLSALEKLQHFFDAGVSWKTAQKEYLLALLPVYYSDDNAIFRQKQFQAAVERLAPLLTAIIRQGIQEGVMKTSYPDQVSEVVWSLFLNLGYTMARKFILREPKGDDLQDIVNTFAAYNDVLERVLGVRTGSLKIIDVEALKEWFPPQETTPAVPGEMLTVGIGVSESR
jgi:hypothetical protein